MVSNWYQLERLLSNNQNKRARLVIANPALYFFNSPNDKKVAPTYPIGKLPDRRATFLLSKNRNGEK